MLIINNFVFNCQVIRHFENYEKITITFVIKNQYFIVKPIFYIF